MKAITMFKKLGYRKIPKEHTEINTILYQRRDLYNDMYPSIVISISFDLENKKIQFSSYYRYTLKELQAINQQVKELGWINES